MELRAGRKLLQAAASAAAGMRFMALHSHVGHAVPYESSLAALHFSQGIADHSATIKAVVRIGIG